MTRDERRAWTLDDHLAHLTALYDWKVLLTPCSPSGAYDIVHGPHCDHADTLQGAVTIALGSYESTRARYYRAGRGDADIHPALIHDTLGVRVLPRWPRLSEHRYWAAVRWLSGDTVPVRRDDSRYIHDTTPAFRDVPEIPPGIAAILRNTRHPGPPPTDLNTKPGA